MTLGHFCVGELFQKYFKKIEFSKMSFGIFIRMLQHASSTNSNWCLQPDSMLCCSRLDQRIKPLVNDVLMMLWWRHLLFFWNLFSLDKIILLDTLSSDWLLRPTNQHRLEKLFIHLSEIFWCNIVTDFPIVISVYVFVHTLGQSETRSWRPTREKNHQF